MSSLNLIILIITFIILILSSKSQEEFPFFIKWQQDFLDNTCKENSVFCPMILAIEDIFNQIKEEEIQTKTYCNKLCLEYNNIHIRDMICQNIEISNSSLYTITLENCSVLLLGEFEYDNKEYKNIKFGTFLSELKIESMSFLREKSLKKMEFIYKNSTKKYNYDTTRSIFKSSVDDLIDQMNNHLEQVYNTFIIKMKEKLEPLEQKEDYFDKAKEQIIKNFIYYDKGNSIFSNIKNITYLYFTNIKPFEQIQIKNKYFFYNMNITFEYALNYNVTYNIGHFIIKNIRFEKDENKNNNYFEQKVNNMTKIANFDILDNSNDIWEIILEEFKKKFNEAKIEKDQDNDRKYSRYYI